MIDIPNEELQAVLQELNQAIYNHEQWYKDLTRTLLCRLPYDRRDVAKNAHRQCRFGQWYYGETTKPLEAHVAFGAIGLAHEHMHQCAAQLLRSSASEAPGSPTDYDNFTNALDRLRLQILTLKHEIEDSIHNRDMLTGAENRIGMLTKLRELLELVKRRAQQCCVALMDLDHFKRINDTHGHIIGDQVLAAAVRCVRGNLRPYDKVFRYGGEEFLLSLQNADAETGRALVERLRLRLAATCLAYDASKPVVVTASFGLAPLDPEVTLEESINRADKALLAAKAAGRNCLRLWEPSLTTGQEAR
jgi:diguanylate cyclase (GGDEF)-like protein